jgi:molybdenum cofactor synthesis domain-containing protein
MMKTVAVEEAVGMVLGHDVTRIVPDQFKGRAFRKGHIITAEDVPQLLDIGKRQIYVLDLGEDLVHEDAAAERIARAAAGPGIRLSEVSEGRVNLIAARPGLLKIRVDGLERLNTVEEVVFATLHSNQAVTAGRAIAGTRIIPLATRRETVEAAEAVCMQHIPLIQVKPFIAHRVGIVTTGSEVYSGRIEDKFGPVVRAKFAELGSQVLRQELVSDDIDMTVAAITGLIDDGADLVAVTGGMSVDPDDQTPASIRAAGGKVVVYGAPVFPGAMFMLATIGRVPVVGLPGCVMYYRSSIFDLILPRILAGESVTRADIVAIGHGGFCEGCAECRYPVCGFGKGGRP